MEKLIVLAGILIAVCMMSVPVHADDPTPKPDNCTQLSNTSCQECIKNVECLWCNTNNTCAPYPYKNVLPPASLCSLGAARWGVCWLNFEAMIIGVSVVGGILIISITLIFCKCCGCCCFSKSGQKFRQEEERMERERQERSMRQSERKLDRQRKNDDIRRKYGLMGSGSRYKPFENEDEQTVAWKTMAWCGIPNIKDSKNKKASLEQKTYSFYTPILIVYWFFCLFQTSSTSTCLFLFLPMSDMRCIMTANIISCSLFKFGTGA